MSEFTQRVIQAIKSIPPGRVATYGQIAALAGSPRSAIIVGQILKNCSDKYGLPWQRVINSKGYISIVNMEYPAELQAKLLESENVTVTKQDRLFHVDLRTYGWVEAQNV